MGGYLKAAIKVIDYVAEVLDAVFTAFDKVTGRVSSGVDAVTKIFSTISKFTGPVASGLSFSHTLLSTAIDCAGEGQEPTACSGPQDTLENVVGPIADKFGDDWEGRLSINHDGLHS